jgi:hypothetical protein
MGIREVIHRIEQCVDRSKISMMQLQGHQLPGAGRGNKWALPWTLWKEHNTTDTLILDLRPPKLYKNVFLSF